MEGNDFEVWCERGQGLMWLQGIREWPIIPKLWQLIDISTSGGWEDGINVSSNNPLRQKRAL